jgi:hypothetical protein
MTRSPRTEALIKCWLQAIETSGDIELSQIVGIYNGDDLENLFLVVGGEARSRTGNQFVQGKPRSGKGKASERPAVVPTLTQKEKPRPRKTKDNTENVAATESQPPRKSRQDRHFRSQARG